MLVLPWLPVCVVMVFLALVFHPVINLRTQSKKSDVTTSITVESWSGGAEVSMCNLIIKPMEQLQAYI